MVFSVAYTWIGFRSILASPPPPHARGPTAAVDVEHTPRSAAQQHHAPPPQVRPTAISREAPTYIDGAGTSTAVAPHACGFDAAAGEAHARSRRRRRRRRLRSSTITARTLPRSHCWWSTHLDWCRRRSSTTARTQPRNHHWWSAQLYQRSRHAVLWV